MKVLLYLILIPFILDFSLSDSLDEITSSLEVIETDKELITQTLSYNEDAPFNIDLTRTTEKIKDGKQKVEMYSVNMALLNEKKVTIKTSKKEMLVIMESSRGKFIQVTEDNKPKGYTNKLEIQCIDIDAARDMKELLEIAIGEAQGEWEESINLPEELDALKSWLASHLSDVNMEKKTISQSLETDPNLADYILITTSDSKSDQSTSYYVPMAEIEANSLKASSSKEIITLDVKSKSNKKVFKESNSKKGDSFKNKMELTFEGASAALEFAKAIEKSITPAEEISTQRIESYAQCNDCMATLLQSVNAFQSEKMNAELIGECDARLTVTDNKGKEEAFQFNWADMNHSSLKENFNSDNLSIKVNTLNKNKFITKYKEGEVSGYDDQLEFRFSELEEMRKSLLALSNVIENCDLTLANENIEWINDRWEESEPINKMNQTFVRSEEDDCSVTLTVSKDESDKTEHYEFNLNDINSESIKLKITGSKLQLEATTNKKEKVINKTDQDGKLEYTNKIVMVFGDINQLRVAEMTMKEEVEGCAN